MIFQTNGYGGHFVFQDETKIFSQGKHLQARTSHGHNKT